MCPVVVVVVAAAGVAVATAANIGVWFLLKRRCVEVEVEVEEAGVVVAAGDSRSAYVYEGKCVAGVDVEDMDDVETDVGWVAPTSRWGSGVKVVGGDRGIPAL